MALTDQAVKDRMTEMGIVVKSGSPAAFGAFLQAETTRWHDVIKAGGFKAAD